MARNRKGRLFYKFLLILLIVSLGPLTIAGYYMLGLSREILKSAALSDQQTLVVGMADIVHNWVNTFRNVLVDAVRLSEFQSANIESEHAVISHLMQIHPSFLEMSILNASGKEVIRVSRFQENPALRDFSADPAFLTANKRGEYLGSLERYNGAFPSLTIAIQTSNNQTGRPTGVLMAKLSMTGLSSILRTGFPDSSRKQVAVVSADGFLICHSDIDFISKPNARLPQEVLDIILRNSDISGEIHLPDGTRALGAFTEVRDLGWIVYMQQPIDVIETPSRQMLKKALLAYVFVGGFVLLLGYVVSLVIVHPIETLREAAVKLGEGQFDDIPELPKPNDEIGELAHTFSIMSESLRIKTAELLSAKEELEKLNRSLETRVEVRTRELRSALDELIKKERLAAVGQMASVVGHEIRNPLAVINNSVYFIKMKLNAAGAVDPKIVKHVSIIESEIQQANGIINEILGYTRSRELMLKPQNLDTYMEEILTVYPFPSHIKLERKLRSMNSWVNIDMDEMRQALRNIIGNGIEVMPDGGTLTVATSTTADNMVKIEISDTGPGMPQEVAEKIFTPFFTTKARGTGLGLAVVKKVVDRHKGRVDVESEPGKGAKFLICLPVYKA